MRITRLIVAGTVAAGGFGLAGCQGDPDTRHAPAGSYDSQPYHDRAASGSPSTGAGIGTGSTPTVSPAVSNDARPDVDRAGAVIQPGGADKGGGAVGNGTGAGDANHGAGTAAGAADTGDASGLTGTGDGRTTGTSRRVPTIAPGDKGGPAAGSSGAAPGLQDNIKRGTGGGGGEDRRN